MPVPAVPMANGACGMCTYEMDCGWGFLFLSVIGSTTEKLLLAIKLFLCGFFVLFFLTLCALCARAPLARGGGHDS